MDSRLLDNNFILAGGMDTSYTKCFIPTVVDVLRVRH